MPAQSAGNKLVFFGVETQLILWFSFLMIILAAVAHLSVIFIISHRTPLNWHPAYGIIMGFNSVSCDTYSWFSQNRRRQSFVNISYSDRRQKACTPKLRGLWAAAW